MINNKCFLHVPCHVHYSNVSGAATVHPKGRARDTRQQRPGELDDKQLHNTGIQAARSVQLTWL